MSHGWLASHAISRLSALPVLTTELADLKRYTITARSTDMIEDAAAWLAQQRTVAPSGRIGMMGISFAGGLEHRGRRPSADSRSRGFRDVVRRARRSAAHAALSLHRHAAGRLPSVHRTTMASRSSCSALAERVVPPDQVEPLRNAILTFLEASRLDMVDKARVAGRVRAGAEPGRGAARTCAPADGLRQRSRRQEPRPGPAAARRRARRAIRHCRHRDRLRPAAAVYLLHGTDDNVIPAVESVLLAGELRQRGVSVEQLATPLITHAEVDRPPTIGEVWTLVRFWGKLLDE